MLKHNYICTYIHKYTPAVIRHHGYSQWFNIYYANDSNEYSYEHIC